MAYTQACSRKKSIIQATVRPFNIGSHKPRFRSRSLSSLPTTKPPVCLHLNCALIREYHVLEVVVQVCCSILQSLGFVSIPDKLAVRAPAIRPSQGGATSQNRSPGHVEPAIRENLLKLTRCRLIILAHLLLNDPLDGLRSSPRSP